VPQSQFRAVKPYFTGSAYIVMTTSFLLYMPVFAALASGKVVLYHPLQAPAGGKVLDVLVSSLHAGFRGSGGRQSSTLPPAPGSSRRKYTLPPAGGAAAGRKVALAGGKVLYRPHQLLQRVEKYFTANWNKFQFKSLSAKLGKMGKKTFKTDKIRHFLAQKNVYQL
jgi:hypothetical protein